MSWSALWGMSRYEFQMQVKRPSLWIGTALLILLMQTATNAPWQQPITIPARTEAVLWAAGCSLICAVVIGSIMADRYSRDRHLQVTELFQSTPVEIRLRIIGKYLGTIGASTLPTLISYFLGICYLAQRWHDWEVVGFFVLVFLIVCAPCFLMVGAISLTCSAIQWLPLYLYQFLFISFWLGIILTQDGFYGTIGIFGREVLPASDHLKVDALSGTVTLLLLLGIASLSLVGLWAYERYQRAHQ